MSEIWPKKAIGSRIMELPKSLLPAGLADEQGAFPFFCSSPEIKRIDKTISSTPSILMGTGGVATIHLSLEPHAYSTDVWAFTTSDDVTNLDFLYRQLEYQLPKIDYSGFEGSGLRHLQKEYIRHLSLSCPPKKEQQFIVKILDTLDTAIAQTQALIIKLKAVKQGLLHDLLTRGIDANGALRPPQAEAPHLYKDSPLGWIPREWEVSCVEAEFIVDSGITLGQHRIPRNNPHRYLRVANVHRAKLKLDDIAYLEASGSEIIEKSLKIGDLLVVEGHASTEEIGRCAMVNEIAEGCLFQNHLFRLRPKKLLDTFALLWMNSGFVRNYWKTEAATSSGLNTINRKKLNKLSVAIPSIKEQQKIGISIETIENRISKEEAFFDNSQNIKSALMTDLLTGRVRVTPLLEAESAV